MVRARSNSEGAISESLTHRKAGGGQVGRLEGGKMKGSNFEI
jgi:hypothetical protein